MLPQTKVFVGSLAAGSKPEELRVLFEQFGEVTECDIMNRCGFVHMATEEQAAAAIRSLHNSNFNGGLITVEKGRIKERVGGRGGDRPGPRGPGGPRGVGDGPMRNGGMGDMTRRPGGAGPMRGGPMGIRDQQGPYSRPYSDNRPPMRGAVMHSPSLVGLVPSGSYRMGMGGGGGGGGAYDAYPDDRYNGYGGEDRRGFALMDRGGRGDSYGASVASMGYPDDRRGGYSSMGAGMDDRAPMYADERRAPAAMYPDERDMMDRRGGGMRPPMQMAPAYDRAQMAPRAAPMGNGDMFSRRSPPPMRGGGGGGGYMERDPYAQQYAPMGRVGGGAGPRGGSDMMGPRRY